jgi:hypothetical protein
MKISHKKSYKVYPDLAVKLGQAAAGKVLLHEEWFDQSGNKTKEIIYSSQGKTEQENEFVFDESGNLIEQRYFFVHEELGEQTKWNYQEGKIQSRIVSFGFGDDEEFVYRYDDDGNLRQIIRVSDDTTAEEWHFHNRLPGTHKIFDEEGNIQSESRLSYDTEGRKIEEFHLDNQNGEEAITRYTYSDNPEPDYEIFNGKNLLKERNTRTYEHLLLIKMVHETFSPDTEVLITEFIYSPEGKEESIKISDANGNVLLESFNEFGDHGLVTIEHRTENNANYGTMSYSTHYEYLFHEASYEK